MATTHPTEKVNGVTDHILDRPHKAFDLLCQPRSEHKILSPNLDHFLARVKPQGSPRDLCKNLSSSCGVFLDGIQKCASKNTEGEAVQELKTSMVLANDIWRNLHATHTDPYSRPVPRINDIIIDLLN